MPHNNYQVPFNCTYTTYPRSHHDYTNAAVHHLCLPPFAQSVNTVTTAQPRPRLRDAALVHSRHRHHASGCAQQLAPCATTAHRSTPSVSFSFFLFSFYLLFSPLRTSDNSHAAAQHCHRRCRCHCRCPVASHSHLPSVIIPHSQTIRHAWPQPPSH